MKSILKGTEVERTIFHSSFLLLIYSLNLIDSLVSRQELVGWLQHQIADQKRVDATTSGALNILETAPVMKDTAVIPEVHLVLPDQKKTTQTSPTTFPR